MLGLKDKKRQKFIIRIVLVSIVPFVLFSWLLYSQIFQQETKSDKHIEAMKQEKKEDKKELAEPSKPEVIVEPHIPVEEPEEDTSTDSTATGDWWKYPDKILETTRSGNDLLVLVNKKYKLPSTYTPSDLVYIPDYGITAKGSGNFYIRKIVINDLKDMISAAKDDGVNIAVVSGYRSYNTQASTYQYWVNYNGGNAEAADTISARPGHSQHQLGTAVDFTSNEIGYALGEEFDNTKASKWLVSNGWKYGFVIGYPKGYEPTTGYSHESWHYRYIGVENAQEWKTSGKILEIWLREKNGL